MSFDEILSKKIRSSKASHEPRKSSHNPFFADSLLANTLHTLNLEQPQKSGKQTPLYASLQHKISQYKTHHLSSQGSHKDKSSTKEAPFEFGSKDTQHSNQTEAPTPKWTFEQQLIIDQLIRLGASTTMKSTFSEIKRSFRKLARNLHPDFHQTKSESQKKHYQLQFQEALELFRSLEASLEEVSSKV